jgi:tRNA(Ile)-lysidine synthase TilS/MesJ
MPYCGHFGCGCCSKDCDKCGSLSWHSDLENGICANCRLEELQNKLNEQEEQKQEQLEQEQLEQEQSTPEVAGHRKLDL